MSLLERIRRIEQGQKQQEEVNVLSREEDASEPVEPTPPVTSRSGKRDFVQELRLFAQRTQHSDDRVDTIEQEEPEPLPLLEDEPHIEVLHTDINSDLDNHPPDDVTIPEEDREPSIEPADEQTLADLKLQIHKQLIEKLPSHLLEADYAQEQAQQEVRRLAKRLLDEESLSMTETQKNRLFDDVMDEVYGLGPIEEFMRDTEVTEIMVNGPNQIYVERHGILESATKRFQDDAHLLRVIQRIVAPINRRLDESNPMVDGRLPDGSRVNAVLPPVSLIGPILTVHKFYKESFTEEDLLEMESLNEPILEVLKACVTSRQDILISGGTSTGKTTMLNMLSSFIPRSDRLITIEDAAELRLNQEHVITLESRPQGVAGRGEITIRDIVRNALRMRPDRIIIGEVRGGEALDMLQAMNTGHEGSMCTIHANSPYDMLSRLETMVMMAGMELPERTIREQIASAIDVIVHMGRLPDGARKVMRISEVCGIEDNQIVLQDIFLYRRRGTDEHGRILGNFTHTGVKPQFWNDQH